MGGPVLAVRPLSAGQAKHHGSFPTASWNAVPIGSLFNNLGASDDAPIAAAHLARQAADAMRRSNEGGSFAHHAGVSHGCKLYHQPFIS